MMKKFLKGRGMPLYMADPSDGLEVNTLNDARGVGKGIYNVDIARTPRVVKSFRYIDRFSIHNEANKVNGYGFSINKLQMKVSR